jgi:outer membrane protein assembly factor BamB
MRHAVVAASLLLFASFAEGADTRTEAERFWGQWRGPRMDGIAPEGNPPIEWSETRNLRWKLALPGLGSSTPVVWKDRLYVLTAIPVGGVEPVPPPRPPQALQSPQASQSGQALQSRQAQPAQQAPSGEPRGERRGRAAEPPAGQEFTVLAINRSDGSIAWRRVARTETPHEGKQPNNSFASASAIVDGAHVIAYFGSRGLFCYDLDGRLVWEKDLGDMQTRNGFGEGASPALAGEKLVVNWDHEGGSFVVALDKKTGKELWRKQRDEGTTWATPLIVEHGGRRQVVTSGTNKVRSYDLETGELLWEAPGLTPNAIPTPVESNGIVYVTSGYRGNAARAIRLSEARGDVTGTPAIVWQTDRDTPYVPSPLLYQGVLYLIKSNAGVLTALDAATGGTLYGPQRLEGISEVYASPVGASGRVYFVGRDGNALVLEGGREYKVVAKSALDDGFDASPVVVGGEMYLRGYRHLYRISAK